MPKRKTTPETELSAAPATEPTAAKARKGAAKPKAATTAAPHRHTHKVVKTDEVEMEAPAAKSTAITHERIAQLAYGYWEARGYQGGSPEEDWLRAERELTILA
jgi:hypothetical protein